METHTSGNGKEEKLTVKVLIYGLMETSIKVIGLNF